MAIKIVSLASPNHIGIAVMWWGDNVYPAGIEGTVIGAQQIIFTDENGAEISKENLYVLKLEHEGETIYKAVTYDDLMKYK